MISANPRNGLWRRSRRDSRPVRSLCRGCSPPASSAPANRARSFWPAKRAVRTRKLSCARSTRDSYPTASCCWWIPRKPAALSRPASPPSNPCTRSKAVRVRTYAAIIRASFPFSRLKSWPSCYNNRSPPVTNLRKDFMPRQTTLKGSPMTLAGPQLKPGDKAPDFTLVDNSLKPVTLKDTGNRVRIISVVHSLDTPVCDAQTKRFNEEAARLPGVDIITVSMDLPFAQKRWCGAFGVDKVKMLSDHKDGSFGASYGTLIKELRIESRAIFVVNADNKVRHAEYVKEVADFPNYETALAAARGASAATA